jgi:V8-like Glu-specific endopeptidase
MSIETRLYHQPVTARQLQRILGVVDRDAVEQATYMSIEVTGVEPPDTQLHLRKDEDRWRVELRLDRATARLRRGLSVESVGWRSEAQLTTQLDGFAPAGCAIRTRPTMEKLPHRRIRVRGPKGDYDPLVVFPGDGRHLLQDSSWPWNLTGRVENSDGAVGSGVLVGDRLMLTAHHMRPDRSIAAGNWWMHFTPQFGLPSGQAPFGDSFVSDLRHYDAESDNEFRVGHDYMLCRLFEPLGQRLGFLGATTFDDDWRDKGVWHNIGYPIDVGNSTQPAVQVNQSIEDDYEDDNGQYMETEASLNHGNSGGPFFSWFDDGHVRLCGVVAAGANFGDDNDNAVAGGPDMVGLINKGRSDWPA